LETDVVDADPGTPVPTNTQMQKDPRTTSELVAAAIAEWDRDDDDAPEGHFWALPVLHAKGTREGLEAALALCASPDAERRKLGARILGELGCPDRTFPEECCDALLSLLEHDSDHGVFEQAIFSLGHLGNGRSLLPVAAHHKDPDDRVRQGVAFALVGCGADMDTPEAISALLWLMNDKDERARDWATTGIAQTLSIDGPEIRLALLERVSDPDPLIRAEALNGLALRRDPRAVPHLIAELSGEEAHIFTDVSHIVLGWPDDREAEVDELLAALQKL
jgi:HEAT repeat protein